MKNDIFYNYKSHEFENISSDQILRWQNAYPELCISLLILQAGVWLEANPNKTYKNYERFLVSWFSRQKPTQQNKNNTSRIAFCRYCDKEFQPKAPTEMFCGLECCDNHADENF
jgi:hypothetical protein